MQNLHSKPVIIIFELTDGDSVLIVELEPKTFFQKNYVPPDANVMLHRSRDISPKNLLIYLQFQRLSVEARWDVIHPMPASNELSVTSFTNWMQNTGMAKKNPTLYTCSRRRDEEDVVT